MSSKLDDFCREMDKKITNSGMLFDEAYDYASSQDPNYITHLFLDDFVWRSENRRNILFEAYGGQGVGKSLFTLDLILRICKIYGRPFDWDNLLVSLDELEQKIKNAPFKTTYFVDEQPKAIKGYGSYMISKEISDFEEMGRFTMKNIGFCSPTERQHASYYYLKEGEEDSIESVINEDCIQCKNHVDCMREKDHKFQTICGIPFWDRHGYPKSFQFMLYKKRKRDDEFIPRGYVKVPMVQPKTFIQYDKVKERNVLKWEKKEDKLWHGQLHELNDFIKEFRTKLIQLKGRKGVKVMKLKGQVRNIPYDDTYFSVASVEAIESCLLKRFGKRRYTIKETKMLANMVKLDLQREVNKLNGVGNFDISSQNNSNGAGDIENNI